MPKKKKKIEVEVEEPEAPTPVERFLAINLDVADELCIAGITIKHGDIVEIAYGRNKTVIGKFIAFDCRLYAISIEAHGDQIIIPYKYVKYITKKGGMQA